MRSEKDKKNNKLQGANSTTSNFHLHNLNNSMAKNTVKRNKGKQASLKTSKAKPMTGRKPFAKSRKRAASDMSGSNDSSPAPKKIKKSHCSRRKAESEEVTKPTR